MSVQEPDTDSGRRFLGARASLPASKPPMSPLHQVKGWHSRGYLPHFDGGPVPQMVTFRLAGSMPAEKLLQWQGELAALPRDKAETEYRRRVETYLDRGLGERWLRDPQLAGLTENALLHFDAARYRLHAWVVMPTHVHVLITMIEGHTLSAVLHSWKSFTAQKANRILKRQGDFWQPEYFDRYIRDEGHFRAAIDYIEQNPVKVALCGAPMDWPWSSARLRWVNVETEGDVRER